MRYSLRKEAVWSDGEPIGADDFRLNWRHNSGRPDHCAGCEPADTTGWAQVDSIDSSRDGRTVTLTLRDGAHDLEWFTRFGPSAYPAHVAAAAGKDWHTPRGMGAASRYFRDTMPTWSGGPYVIDSAVVDRRAVLTPNSRWYGRDKPTLDRIVKEVVSDPPSWATAIANGELDGGAPLAFDPDVAQRLRGADGVSTAIAAQGATWEHVDANLASPRLADPALRRAIFTALDTRTARARLFGKTVPTLRTNHFFANGTPHHEDLLAGTGFGSGDLAAARKLLADAGYTGAAAGETLSKAGRPVAPLRFAFIAGHPTRGTYVELAQATLREIGIRVKPVGVPGPQFGKTLGTGAFDLVILAFDGGPLFTRQPALYFRSDSPINFSRLADDEIDRGVDAIAGAPTLAAAAGRTNELDKRVIAQASMLPLWENPAFAFVRDGYVNVRDNLHSLVRAMYEIGAWGRRGDG